MWFLEIRGPTSSLSCNNLLTPACISYKSEKMHAIIPKGLSSRFLDFSMLGKSEKMAQDIMDVCLQVLKEGN